MYPDPAILCPVCNNALRHHWRSRPCLEHMKPNTRAITPEQKDEVMRRLLLAWKKHPAQRLGQLLWNANSQTNQADLFYVEDYELVRATEEF